MKVFARNVFKTVEKYKMLTLGESVVIGVSGGPDSVVLAHAMKIWQRPLGLDISVAHFDHQVRRGSGADCRFVARLSASLNFPFYGGVLSRRKIAKKGSLEDQLRNHRYTFLESVCRKTGAKKLVLGHTRDDQAETVLMRLLRGSGLYGLSAIQPRLWRGGIEIVRPFIETGKDEVLRAARGASIVYRVDATNEDKKFFRNKIRHHLLPLLEKEYNPNIRDVLAGTASSVGADYAYLCREAQVFLDRYSVARQGRCVIKLPALAALDISIRRLALRLAAFTVKGDLRRVSFKHFQEMEDLIFSRPAGSEVHLPEGLAAVKSSKNLVLYSR
jgi:tRNA(Ile)-lysidine synthase